MKKIYNPFIRLFLLAGLFVLFSNQMYGQFGCNSGVVITNGFTQMGITTPGNGGIEDWNVNPTGTSINASYWDDDVYLFEYTAGITAENISMTIFTRNSWNGIGIFDECNGNEFSNELDASGSSSSSNVAQTVTANVSAGNTVYIAVGQWGTPDALDFDVTNFTVTQILCAQPVALNATSVLPTSANLVWTEAGTATTWDIEWGASGFTPTGTPNISGAISTTQPISGLTSGSSYSFYVRANCGANGFSNWSGPFTFTTPLLVAPPFTEGFATTTTPAGWNTTGWTIGSTRGVTGNPGNNIYKNIFTVGTSGSSFTSAAVGPVTADMIFSFDYIVALYSSPHAPPAAGTGDFVLEVSTDFGATFTVVETVPNNGVAGWQSKVYPLTAFAGQNVSFKITGNWVSGDWDMAFDNFVVEIPPACLVASDIVISNILQTGADASWTASPDETNGYNWVVMNVGDIPGTDTPFANGTTATGITSATVSGLTALTSYDFYVQTNCGVANGLSDWLGPNVFTTAADCSIYTLSATASGGGVCYEGTVTLTATAGGGGSDIFWYDTATGGDLLGIGSSFDTPFIDETTSFWAAEVVHSGQITGQAFATPTLFTNSVGAGGLLFTVTNPIIIVDVEVFGTNATGGDITIELRDIGNGNATIASTTATISGGGTTGAPISHIVPLSFEVPAAGNYRLVKTAPTTGIGLGYVTAANSSFPYPLGSSGQVTGGATATGTSTIQYYFFNWTIIESLALCESTRDEAIATVYEFIPVVASASQTSINPGGSTTLNATSTNTNFNYVWTWDGGGPLAGSSVNVSPAVHTTYTVTATDPVTGCITTDEITILVFNTALCNDLDITSVDGAYICDEGTAILSVTPAGISGNQVYWYDTAIGGDWIATGATFETPVLTQTTSYWAAEVLLEITPLSGQAFANPTVFTNSTSNSNGLLFTVTSPINIVDVQVFKTNATDGDIVIELRDITNGNAIIATTTASLTGAGTATAPIPHTIPLNFAVPAAGNYRLVRSGATPTGVGMGYVTAANSSFPYPLGTSGEVTGGSSLTGTSTFQYYFFNWTIEEFLFLCESPREEVIATVVETIAVEASATQTSINPGGSTTLNATSTNPNYDYEWTWDGGGPSVGPSVVVSPMSYTTYTVTATDPITGCVATDEITILVFDTTLCNDLDITTVTGGYVCVEGTTILSATAAGITGDDIYWYDSEFDGILLGTGTTFETPVINTTTSYWAAEVLLGPGVVSGQGKLTPTTTSGYTLTAGLFFEAFDAFTIIDVEAFSASASAGVITSIQLQDGSGTLIAGQEVTNVPVPGGGTGAAPVPFTITLNFDVPGPGLYRLLLVGSTPSLIRDSGAAAAGSFPKPLGEAAEITGSVLGTAAPTTTTYYFFYNWTVTGDMVYCESSREEVIATVVDIDEVDVTATQMSISPGSSTTLTASSTNTNYTYVWTWDGGTDSGASIMVSPLVHTTYTVTATDSVTGCVATNDITILVFDLTLCNPLDITATTGDTLCVGETANLSATASGTGDAIYWYDAEFGGNKLGEGATFETPVLTSTTSYWAAEALLETSPINSIETIYTVGTSNSVTTYPAYITFAIQNTNNYNVILTGLDNYMPANTTRSHELWYHTTNLTGSPGTIDAGGGWVLAASEQTTTSGATIGISPVIDNISVTIPANTTWRFALIGTANISGTTNFYYWGSSTVIASPNIFSESGVNLLVNDNSAGGTGFVGYGSGNNPRGFTGLLHLESELVLCESDREEAVATVTSDAAPVGDANQDFAPGETLANLIVTGTGLIWYEDAAGTIVLPDTTPLVDGATYYVSQTVNGCESQLLAVTVTLVLPCDAPTALILGTVTHNTAQFSWTASANETGGYAWYVFAAGADPNTATPVATGNVATGITTVNVSSLSASTAYDFYVATLCTGGVESAKAGPLNFTTGASPCDAPTALILGTVTHNTAQFSWTASANETGGYAWYVFTAGANPNTATPVATGNVATGITTVNVSSLSASTAYDFYVATLCTGGVESAKAGPLNYTTGAPPCNAPTALILGTVTHNTAQFSWTASANETGGYAWYVFTAGANPNTATPVATGNVATGITTVNVSSLSASTAYDFYVATLCTGGVESAKAGPLNFTTDAAICDIPSDITQVQVDVDFAEFSWTASATETNGYDWAVFIAGDNPLVDPAVTSGSVATGITSVMVTGLNPITAYDFYVRTNCGPDGLSDWEGPSTFTTQQGASVNDFDINSIAFYPNPMVDVVNISAQIEIENVVIFSLTGQKLIEQRVGNTVTQIDVSNFASGPYLIQVTTSTGKTGIFRLIKK